MQEKSPNSQNRISDNFDAPDLFDLKTKRLNGHFAEIYEFLALDVKDSAISRHAKLVLQDAFNEYRKAVAAEKKPWTPANWTDQRGHRVGRG